MRLPLDRHFTVAGFGTVITGTLASGQLKVGDALEIDWEQPLDAHQDSAAYPHVFASNDDIMLFWIVPGDPATMQVNLWQDATLKLIATASLPDLTVNLQATALDADLIVTRLVGARLTPQLLRIHKGNISHQVSPQAITTGGIIHTLRMEKQLVALWQNHAGDRLYWQWLDRTLTPLRSPQTIYTTQQGKIRSLRPYPAPDVAVLIHVLENQPTGEMIQVSQTARGGRFQQAENLVQKLFLTDGTGSSDALTLPLNGSPYFIGGWIQEQFYLLHGEQTPTLSVVMMT